MCCTWNAAVYQIFGVISLRNLYFAFWMYSWNIYLRFSAYYFITVILTQNIYPLSIVHKRIQVKLTGSSLNYGHLEREGFESFLISTHNVHLQLVHVYVRLLLWWCESKHQNLSRIIMKPLIFPSRLYFLLEKKTRICQIVNLVILDCHLKGVPNNNWID